MKLLIVLSDLTIKAMDDIGRHYDINCGHYDTKFQPVNGLVF